MFSYIIPVPNFFVILIFFLSASDCGPSFQPYTLVETQVARFVPTKKYLAMTRLRKSGSSGLLSRWRKKRSLGDALDPEDTSIELSVSFRTLQSNGRLLAVSSSGGDQGATRLEIVEGVLTYLTRSSGRSEINMTTGVTVNDGGWHTVTLAVDRDNRILTVNLDQQVRILAYL